MGGDVPSLYDNADELLLQGEEEIEDDVNLLDATSPDIIADLSTILDDPYTDPPLSEIDPEEADDERMIHFRGEEVVQNKWRNYDGNTIREVEEGEDEDQSGETEKQKDDAKKPLLEMSPICEAKD